MDTREYSSTVVFRRPFILNGLEGVQPSGTYNVEAREELLDTMAYCGYRRISTSIELHGQPPGITRMATVDPQDLENALVRDAAGVETQTGRADACREPQVMQSSDVTARSQKAVGGTDRAGVYWVGSGNVRHAEVERPIERVFKGWSQWVSLNANELTWIALVVGAFLLTSLIR